MRGRIGSDHVRRVMTSSFLPDNPLTKTVELPRGDGGKEIFTLPKWEFPSRFYSMTMKRRQ